MPTVRNILLTICAFVYYWAVPLKETITTHLATWMPDMEMIPLQILSPVRCVTAAKEGGELLVAAVPVLVIEG